MVNGRSRDGLPPRPPPAEVVAAAFAELGIERAHGTASEAEAAAWRERPGLDDPALVDLTALPFVTVDDDGARDLDQALHVAREEDGYRVRYAIADAAYYVRPGSALFAEALARGASYYSPLGAAPMLPRALSEDLVSLNPEVERRALVFDLRLDEDGLALSTAVLRARIRSRARLGYRAVQGFLDGRDGAGLEEDVARSLELLAAVGRRRVARERARGAVPFDRHEPEIRVAGSPPRFVAAARERLEVADWNAQLSLLCNIEGAALLAGLDAIEHPGEDRLQPIYRVHEAPLERRLDALRGLIGTWATRLDLGPRWRWREGQSLADYVDGLPDTPRERPRARAVQRQILMAQRASEFRAERGPHHAIAAPVYARLSSPMREVVGVFTHKELLEALGAGDGAGRNAGSVDDAALRAAVIDAANAARARQKALDKRVGFAVIADLLCADLGREPRPARAGTVLGLRGERLYVGLDDPGIDLKVDTGDLERRHGTPYRVVGGIEAVPDDPRRPRFVLGDTVTLRAAGYEAARERFRLDLVPHGAAAGRARRR